MGLGRAQHNKLKTMAHTILGYLYIKEGNILVGLAYQGKDIVFRFIIEHSSLRNIGPYIIGLSTFI